MKCDQINGIESLAWSKVVFVFSLAKDLKTNGNFAWRKKKQSGQYRCKQNKLIYTYMYSRKSSFFILFPV